MRCVWLPLLVVLLCGGGLVASGCRKRKTTEPAEPPPPVDSSSRLSAPQTGSAPQPGQTQGQPSDRLPTAPNDSSLRLPVHRELTDAVHLYEMDHQKLPLDFETLVKAKYLKAMPQPPPGKRFAFDRNRLQVVVMD
jgi:hypothetical protein